MMKWNTIRSMAVRKYENIPIQKIKVLNSRNRDREDFEKNIRSIKEVGLRKPILVNEQYYKKTGFYDLVCGEGRFLAYRELNYQEIPAEVIGCDKKQALLFSLVENIARVSPGTMWFAQEIKRLFDTGFSYPQISTYTGYSETYIKDYIRLVEQGEARLIQGVTNGLFPMSFAVNVAKSNDADIQNILMDAFDSRIVNSSNFPTVRKIIMARVNQSKRPMRVLNTQHPRNTAYTVKQLKNDISRITKEKEAFVNEASLKENRLLLLWDGLKSLGEDQELARLILAEGIGSIPTLKGDYHVR